MEDGVGSAPACYGGSSLGSNPDIYQKNKMGDISKGVANTLQPAKKKYLTKIIQNNYIIQKKMLLSRKCYYTYGYVEKCPFLNDCDWYCIRLLIRYKHTKKY